MADQPTSLKVFTAEEFSAYVHSMVADNREFSKGQLEGKTPLSDTKYKEIVRDMASVSEEVKTEEGKNKILERFGINKDTSADYRLVICESPAGTVCFKAKHPDTGDYRHGKVSEDLILYESFPLTLATTAGTPFNSQTAAIVESEGKTFKPLPQPKLIPESDMNFDAGPVNLTPQAAEKIATVIKMIRLADEAAHAPAQTINAVPSAPVGLRVVTNTPSR